MHDLSAAACRPQDTSSVANSSAITPPSGQQLQVSRTHRNPGVVIVTAAGEIDLATAGQLGKELWQDLPATTVLDLTGVNFLGAAGLWVIESTAGRARAERRRFGVVAGTHVVQRVLHLFSVETRVPLYLRLANAIRELPGTPLPPAHGGHS
ncbi:STAS domain-containing protein [Amycolatopsis sp. lyj-84]|uniref:STAS domain-containing protein n=1 Tax=Amycolatopsis sp. lyj-84 TaxID=2789284 RepID=UPI00397E48D1